ncbi:MAG: hypothetical protein GY853_13665 [PVC group bacterium]|nr:hypothetical protein [PVC group bacterium]
MKYRIDVKCGKIIKEFSTREHSLEARVRLINVLSKHDSLTTRRLNRAMTEEIPITIKNKETGCNFHLEEVKQTLTP